MPPASPSGRAASSGSSARLWLTGDRAREPALLGGTRRAPEGIVPRWPPSNRALGGGRVRTFSAGMAAPGHRPPLVARPRVLLLDEPFTGLDQHALGSRVPAGVQERERGSSCPQLRARLRCRRPRGDPRRRSHRRRRRGSAARRRRRRRLYDLAAEEGA
jgi:hypothetical protein